MEPSAPFGATSLEEDRKIRKSVDEGLSDDSLMSLLASKMAPS